ncbi:hypothetical protein VIGAN_09162600 [Vigna angularis var. angularis]|uniref:Uncharacterized protein n=1 Tax=Vigna angularis var. angularis TaxID=157739 RepID=A0A0S3SYK7_PHAAN|nr:hypothetical protein VIGAN_09162600 [Vigna angularis var. angularis]
MEGSHKLIGWTPLVYLNKFTEMWSICCFQARDDATYCQHQRQVNSFSYIYLVFSSLHIVINFCCMENLSFAGSEMDDESIVHLVYHAYNLTKFHMYIINQRLEAMEAGESTNNDLLSIYILLVSNYREF